MSQLQDWLLYIALHILLRRWESWLNLLNALLRHVDGAGIGIKEEERMYECRDCLERYDLTPSVCKSCYPILSANHTPGHQWITYVYIQKKGVDDNLFQFQCVDCYRGTYPLLESLNLDYEIRSAEINSLRIWFSEHCSPSPQGLPCHYGGYRKTGPGS